MPRNRRTAAGPCGLSEIPTFRQHAAGQLERGHYPHRESSMNSKFEAPEFLKNRFTCLHVECHAVAHHEWCQLSSPSSKGGHRQLETIFVAICGACQKKSIWLAAHLIDLESMRRPPSPISIPDIPEPERRKAESASPVKPTAKIIFPVDPTGPLPVEDMPDDVKALYDEARSVARMSPKSAAALLRLAVETLMPHLGEKGKKTRLVDKIGNLVKKGLLEKTVQEALDSVRIIGNDAVHPGKIILDENPEVVPRLFNCLNYIVEKQITVGKSLKQLYDSLPEEKKKEIVKRDKRPLG